VFRRVSSDDGANDSRELAAERVRRRLTVGVLFSLVSNATSASAFFRCPTVLKASKTSVAAARAAFVPPVE